MKTHPYSIGLSSMLCPARRVINKLFPLENIDERISLLAEGPAIVISRVASRISSPWPKLGADVLQKYPVLKKAKESYPSLHDLPMDDKRY